MASDQAINCD